MITAVLLALRSGPDGCTALLPSGEQTVLARLADLLRGLGVTDLTVIGRPADAPALRAAAPDAVIIEVDRLSDALASTRSAIMKAPARALIIDADVLVHAAAVQGLIADPRVKTGLLVGPRMGARPIATQRGAVVSAASPFHLGPTSGAGALGMLVIDATHRDAAATAAHELASLARTAPDAWRAFVPDVEAESDVVALMTVGVVRAGVPVRCSYIRELFWARPVDRATAAELTAAIGDTDEARALMNSSVKATDGFFGTFFCSPYTKYIARAFAGMGIKPNHVSVFSLALGLAAAAMYARGNMIAGAVLLYLTLAFDCVDGQLARFTRGFTALGAWLDPTFDRIKEYSVYAGLAMGAATATTATKSWGLACAAIALLTARHFADFSFGVQRQEASAAIVHPPLDVAGEQFGPAAIPGADEWSEGHEAAGHGGRLGALIGASRAANRVAGVVWVKRIIQFPIGERYAAIAVASIVAGPVAVFVITLAWGVVALAYSSAGRIVRSIG